MNGTENIFVCGYCAEVFLHFTGVPTCNRCGYWHAEQLYPTKKAS